MNKNPDMIADELNKHPDMIADELNKNPDMIADELNKHPDMTADEQGVAPICWKDMYIRKRYKELYLSCKKADEELDKKCTKDRLRISELLESIRKNKKRLLKENKHVRKVAEEIKRERERASELLRRN
jgi:adenylosuccinate lyase